MPSTDVSMQSNSTRPLTYVAYIAFLPIGIATILLGPMLPTLSARWSLNYAQAGALFNAQYFASTCAVACSGVLAARWGFRFPIKIGLLLMAVGLSFLLSGSKLVGILCIGCYGGGLGLAVPAANLLVAAANPARRSAALNLLNFFWSMGAVACPFLVAAAAKSNHLPALMMSVAGFSLATAIAISLMPSRVIEPATIPDAKPMRLLIQSKVGAFSILAVLFLLYVGVENSFGQWMATYAKSLGTLSLATALATPSFFYASLMLGRWLAPFILRFVEDQKLVQAGSLLACAGMAGLIFSHNLTGIALSACAAGLGLSSVYPITISFLSRQFESGSIGSLMFTLSNIGGGLLPWIVGLSSNCFGTLKAGLLVPLLGSTIMYALFLQGSMRRAALSD